MLLLLAGCAQLREPASEPARGTPIANSADPWAAPFLTATSDTSLRVGLHIRLVDAESVPRIRTRPPTPSPLDAAAAQEILERLLGPAEVPAPPPSFRFATRSIPAPRPGRIISGSFASGAAQPLPSPRSVEPLRVLRSNPRGVVARASQISVSFSRPMVPLSAVDRVPEGIRVTPAVRGSWRWLDPFTLVHESDEPLPGATRFTVEIPRIAAADGEFLDEPVRWTFATAPAAVRSVVSTAAPELRRPVIVVTFDQQVDRAVVPRFLELLVEGVSIPLDLATAEEQQLPAVRGRLARVSEHTVALRPARPLPAIGTASEWRAVLRVLPGLPSREGPEVTTASITHEFIMRRGLRVVRHGCGRAAACAPGLTWTIEFNYPLRPPGDSASQVRVEPALPGATVEVWSNHIVVLGSPRENTTYTIQLDPSIAMWSGDSLGRTEPLRFTVDPPLAAVWAPGGGLAVLSGRGPARYTLLAEGTDSVRIQLRAVKPENWRAYHRVWTAQHLTRSQSALPGRLLQERVLSIIRRGGGVGEVLLELDSAFAASEHLVLSAQPVAATKATANLQSGALVWIQRSSLLADVAADVEALTVRTTSAATAKPVAGVALELMGGADSRPDSMGIIARANSNADGVAVLRAARAARGTQWIIRATDGNRTVLFPNAIPPHKGCCDPSEWSPMLRSHFVTNRPLHAPGHTVRFAGWLRLAAGVGRELSLPAAGAVVRYTLSDPRGQTIVTGELPIQGGGRVEGEVALPLDLNSGSAQLRFELHQPDAPQQYAYLPIEIQEVRRPDMEVGIRLDPGPHTPGAEIVAVLSARYFTGGALPDAGVTWTVRSYPAHFQPPGVREYSFGWARYPAGQQMVVRDSGRTDAEGQHRIRMHIDSVYPKLSMLLRAEATATDVDRQRRSAVAAVLVHPADVYVGLRTPSRFVRAGETVIVELVVVDIDGKPVAGRPIRLRALRQDRSFRQQTLELTETVRARCTARSLQQPVQCPLQNLPAGDYILFAEVEDAKGRQSISEHAIRVAGETIPSGAYASRDTVVVTPQRAEYSAGDSARVLIQASFPASQALLSIRRAGVLSTRLVALDKGLATVTLPITDGHVPNIQLHVSASTADGALVNGITELVVLPRSRTLDVTVEPSAPVVAPGTRTTVRVSVKDAEGRPVPDAQIVLSAVDEALYALTRRPLGNPLADYYPRSAAGVIDRTLRTHLAPRQTGGGKGEITGVVVDGMTGQPLTRAWVQQVGSDRGAWTEPDGSYRLTNVSAARLLEARAAGYVTGYLEGVVVGQDSARAHFVLLTRNAVLAGARDYRALAFSRLDAEGRALALDELVVVAEGIMAASVATIPPPAAPPPAYALRVTTARDNAARTLLRSNFSAVAAFVGNARTGPDGRAEISVQVPDNLSRYRLRVVASEGTRRFGVGESSLTARLSLMARLEPPRFLHHGDRFDLPVVLENRADSPLSVDVAVRATNAALLQSGQRVVVPAGDRVELRFPAIAGESGSARFQLAAVSNDGGGSHADAAEVILPVLMPAVTEAFAVYGELDDARPVGFPLQIPVSLPGQSQVEIGFSSTAAHGLSDALLFLLLCPFDLPEVLASRVLALSTLRGTSAAASFPQEAIDAVLRADVDRLARLQLQDGGWSLWTARFDADPFVSVHVAHALRQAAATGVTVPRRTIDLAARWLEQLDQHTRPDTVRRGRPMPRTFPDDYPQQARRTVQAYALDIRRQLGQDVAAPADSLLREEGPGALSAEALAWLLPALTANPAYGSAVDDVQRELAARVVRSAGTAALVSPYDAGGHHVFYSPRRTDAVVLAALIESGAMPELRAALARGLFAHRVRGRWANTQENAYAVAALSRYIKTAESIDPEFVARAWTGPRLVDQRTFAGRSDDRHDLVVPADSLGSAGTRLNVVVAREGEGRLYYRVGLKYALATGEPIARGFTITRSYEAVDHPDDVQRAADRIWRIRLGARVRVSLTLAAVGPRYHVAVIDPLPAGLEAVNASLAGNQGLLAPPTVQPAPTDSASALAWFQPAHVNVKADRYEAFTTLLRAGRWQYSYLTLATTPGQFAAPAPRAEEMYAPETFGRGAAERVIIEDRLPR